MRFAVRNMACRLLRSGVTGDWTDAKSFSSIPIQPRLAPSVRVEGVLVVAVLPHLLLRQWHGLRLGRVFAVPTLPGRVWERGSAENPETRRGLAPISSPSP